MLKSGKYVDNYKNVYIEIPLMWQFSVTYFVYSIIPVQYELRIFCPLLVMVISEQADF